MYKIPWYNGQWNWQSGQYVKFSLTGNATNPYEGKVYNSNGTLAGTIGTGHIINMGVDGNGKAMFFFVGNDNNTGQLFTSNFGMSGTSGYTWTGTLNPTTAQVDSFANSYGSTSPLASGQSYSPPPPGPTITGGTITQTNSPGTEIITSGSNSTAGPTNTQTTNSTNWNNNSNPNNVNNYLYVEQVSGNYNSVTINQSGTNDKNHIIISLEVFFEPYPSLQDYELSFSLSEHQVLFVKQVN